MRLICLAGHAPIDSILSATWAAEKCGSSKFRSAIIAYGSFRIAKSGQKFSYLPETCKNNGQSYLARGAPSLRTEGSDPQIFPSRWEPGPLSNAALLRTTWESLPKDISFRPTAIAGCTSVTDDIHTDGKTDRPRYCNMCRNKSKGKDKCRGTCYSADYTWTSDQKCFTISEVAAEWHELMIPRRTMRLSTARTSEQFDPRCSTQTYHRPNQLH